MRCLSQAKHICQHISILQLSRLAGVYVKKSVEEVLQISRDLILRYRKGLEFGETFCVACGLTTRVLALAFLSVLNGCHAYSVE